MTYQYYLKILSEKEKQAVEKKLNKKVDLLTYKSIHPPLKKYIEKDLYTVI